jgi:hypothetical protein
MLAGLAPCARCPPVATSPSGRVGRSTRIVTVSSSV